MINGEDILLAIGDIDDKLLAFRERKSNLLLFKRLSLAACIMLVIGVALYPFLIGGLKAFDPGIGGSNNMDAAPPMNGAPSENNSASTTSKNAIVLDKYGIPTADITADSANLIDISDGMILVNILTDDGDLLPLCKVDGMTTPPLIYATHASYEVVITPEAEEIIVTLSGGELDGICTVTITVTEDGMASYTVENVPKE